MFGVETEEGSQYRARVGVVSSVRSRPGRMAAAEMWGEGFVYGVDTYDEGLSSSPPITPPPRRRSPLGRTRPIGRRLGRHRPLAGGVIEFGHGLRERRLHRPGTFLLFATPPLINERRGPVATP